MPMCKCVFPPLHFSNIILILDKITTVWWYELVIPLILRSNDVLMTLVINL